MSSFPVTTNDMNELAKRILSDVHATTDAVKMARAWLHHCASTSSGDITISSDEMPESVASPTPAVTSAPVDLPAGIVYRNCGRELLNLSNRKKTAITNNNQAVLRDIEAKITMLKEIKARNEMLGWTDPETKLDRLRAKQHYSRRNNKSQAELEAIQHEIEKAKAEARAMPDA